ncbi:uncharacterized protein LOC135241204 isoform X1 [Anguilla rostrata]|uniref:uncharacterized protein LOC135241204 isoform X1 n=1 Tax=Anguilla rostrata TaxID=7938 RepID=UPI0030D62F08
MASYSRFDDEKYKNWLKTTMSLQLLRSRLSRFIENETDTFHNSLRNKLKEAICKQNCSIKIFNKYKVSPVCPDCQLWMNEILKNHNNKKMEIYWNNSKPHLWSFDKWEVAKVYMPRGNKNHNAVDQFDISAIVNLMIFCSHFKKFVKDQVLKEVTNVRNQMMHSPDMKVAKEDMKKHLKKILNVVGHLQVHVPELNELENEINELEEAELNIRVGEEDTSRGDVTNLLNKQKILDLEQQVMKEKIEHLTSRLEDDKELNNEEYLTMKEFLDQNKDLLKQLGPQMEKLNAIEVKVEEHDKQLTVLSETVDQIVKKTEEPVFSADVVKYKNHLFEEAKKNKWPDPVFTEVRKPQGYIGRVEVNGQTYTGCRVHLNKIAAHQEVAMIALEQMDIQSTKEGSLTLHHADQSASASTAANSLFFAAVKVPVKTDFEGPEAETLEAAVLEAYKSLEQAMNLGDTGAGSPSDSARQTVHNFFSQAGCGPPEERSITTNGKFRSKLCINGDLTFQNPEGMSKKLHAEQAAAKDALLRLAGVLGWDLVGVNENYKGRLQEILIKQGHTAPSYQRIEPSNRGAESEKNLASVPVLQATVSVSNIESQARASVDSSQYPPQLQKPKTETPAPVMPAVQPSESNLPQSSGTDVPVEHYDTAAGQAIVPAMSIDSNESSVSSANSSFFAAVKVAVKTDFEGPEAETSEAAVLEAYTSLEQALNLGDTGAGSPPDGPRQRVHDFFSQAGCGPPEERNITTNGKFRSKLCINGDLTFQNPDGMPKKQQAEQAAAKKALLRLAGVLGWDLAGVNENYKGRLQELLVKQGQTPPSYQRVSQPSHTEPSDRGAASETSGADVSTPQTTGPVSTVKPLRKPPVDQPQLLPDRKKPRLDNPDFGRMLKMFGLQPTSVIFDNFNVKENVRLTMEINLHDFPYTTQQGYHSKKDAIRKTYLKFGQAIGICEPNTEENQSSMAVKQYFSQKSLSLPTEEVVEKEQKKFFCSLKVPSCRLSYEGQGESEEAAKLEACTQALSQLCKLFHYKLTCSSVEPEERLTLLLEEARQLPPGFQKPDTQYKATVQLNLNNFALESKGQSSKKSAQSQLCCQILMLLGEKETMETKKPVSERNQVDDWFKQKRLPPPVFEDSKESGPDNKDVFRMKAKFSGCVTCTHPDWQASKEEAANELMEELKRRFQDC